MRRSIAFLPLATLLLATWGHAPGPKRPPDDDVPVLSVAPVAMPPRHVLASYLGPFHLEGAWRISSRSAVVFGYSALVPRSDGKLTAINDGGYTLTFSPPGAKPSRPEVKRIVVLDAQRGEDWHDVESVIYDAASDRYWAGIEGMNAVVRVDRNFRQTGRVEPKGMADWGSNTGPEAMTRLADGRFVVIREIPPTLSEPRLHDALLFSGDPVEHPDAQPFRFDGPDNFSVVDMAMLPDGRALILMRRLLWPMPMRFAGRIVIADTATIRAGGVWRSAPLASLASVLPVDNFEAIAAVPEKDGRITVWITSDDNAMRVLQRTLLWKLSVDPKRLPWPK